MLTRCTKIIILLLMLLLINGQVHAKPLCYKTPYYQGYQGYHTFRIPSLISATDGTLLAFAEGRRSSSGDTGNIDLVLRRSVDFGNTWKALQVVWSDGDNTCGNPVPVVDHSNGRIWLFMTHNLGQDTQSEIFAGTSDGIRTIWSCYSDDSGATWSVPVNRFNEVQPLGTRWDATGPGNGIQIENGFNPGRLVIPAESRNIQSDDHGLTWYQSMRTTSNTGEGAVVELNYGTLFRNDRATSSWKSFNRRVICYSYDQGNNWTSLQICPELVCPICQASTISYLTDDNTRLILFSNPAATTRIRMTVKCSYNNARNWPLAKMIYKKDSAYSSLAELANNEVGLLYENGDGWPYHRISYARFDLDWMQDSTVFCWDFEEYAPGQEISAKSNAVFDSRGYALNGKSNKNITVIDGSQTYNGTAALKFDGIGQNLIIDDIDSKDILDFDADESFLIRVTFRTEAHAEQDAESSGSLVAKDVGTSQPSWWFRVQAGKLVFFVDDGSESTLVRSNLLVNDNIWHEAIAFRDSEQKILQIYLDGVLSGESLDDTTGTYANDNDLVIGSFNDGSRSFIGEIDKVQIVRGDMSDVVLLQQGDLNGDNLINMDDLNILLQNWITLY